MLFAPLSGGGADTAGVAGFAASTGAGACPGAIGFGASATAACIGSAGCAVFAASTGDVFAGATAIFPAAGAAFSITGVTLSAAGVAISVAAGIFSGASVACPGLISILACSAIISEVTGGSSAGCCGGIASLSRLSRETRAAGSGLARAFGAVFGAAAACCSGNGVFSACWKATSIT